MTAVDIDKSHLFHDLRYLYSPIFATVSGVKLRVITHSRQPWSTLDSVHNVSLFSAMFTESKRSWADALATVASSVVSIQWVATRYSTPDTPKWTLYIWLNITLHWSLQQSTIFQSLHVWSVRINTKIYIKFLAFSTAHTHVGSRTD